MITGSGIVEAFPFLLLCGIHLQDEGEYGRKVHSRIPRLHAVNQSRCTRRFAASAGLAPSCFSVHSERSMRSRCPALQRSLQSNLLRKRQPDCPALRRKTFLDPFQGGKNINQRGDRGRGHIVFKLGNKSFDSSLRSASSSCVSPFHIRSSLIFFPISIKNPSASKVFPGILLLNTDSQEISVKINKKFSNSIQTWELYMIWIAVSITL